jgi:TrmH family RNA methyltransferase
MSSMTHLPLSINKHQKYASLQQKKYRQKYNKFIVEGEKLVEELINSSITRCECVIVVEGYQISDYLKNQNIKIFNASKDQIKRLSVLSTPPPILAIVQNLSVNPIEHLILSPRSYLFYLDGLKDPGNLGTIIRVGEWFGFEGIILGPECVDPFNSKVIQSSMGSIFRLPIYEGHLSSIINQSPDCNLVGLDMDGEAIENKIFEGPLIFVIGSESHGISHELTKYLKSKISIQKKSTSHYPESLNAATAAAIAAFYITLDNHKS